MYTPLSTRKRLNAIATQVFLLGLVWWSVTATNAIASCGDDCLTYNDCGGGMCPVCNGICVDCPELGDQASCEAVGTGAEVFCLWSGTACYLNPLLAETPTRYRPYILLGLSGLIVGTSLFLRRKKTRS